MKLGKKVTVLFVLALLTICIVGIQSYMGIRQVNEANRVVIQTQLIQEKLEHILSMLKDAETGQRGFVLTGKDSYLDTYNTAVDEIPRHIDEVASLIHDPEQQKSIELLKKLSHDMFDELDETIKLRRASGMDAALYVILQDRGKKIMDDMRALMDQMENRENKLLDERKLTASQTTRRSILMLGFGVLLALIILGVAALTLSRTMKLADQSPISRDSGRNWKKIAIRYLFAAVVVSIATVLRWWLVRTFGPMPLFVTWYPAVLLTAIIAGGGPGILATLLSVLVSDYWFIAPAGFGISATNDAIATGIFSGTGIFLSIFAERLKRAQLAESVSRTQEKELALLNEGNLMTLDLDHRIISWSEGNRKLYGFSIQEVRGKLTYELLRTQFPQPMEEIHKEFMEKNHWEGEVTRLTKDGAPLVVALLWALRRDEDGKPLAILEVSTDITRQKLAEESLREQAEELAQQNEELHAQSEELAQQSEELSEQNEELQTQSEEIQSLNTELTHREHMLEILLDAAHLSVGEHEVIEKICQAALDMIGPAACGAVVCESGDNELRILAYTGFETCDVPNSWPVKDSFIEMVMQQNRTAALEDSSLRPDFKLIPVTGLAGLAAVLSSPLHINGKCIGAVSVYGDKPQQWTAEQFRLIEWLAAKCSDTLEAMRLTEEVLRGQKQNEFLASVIQRSTQAFGVGYHDGSLGLINKAFEELTGYTGEELRSIDWAKTLTPPEWFEIEKRKLEELNITGLSVRYEKEYIRKDGKRVPIELLVHIIKDEEGQPLYYYSFINDITERKAAEEALRRSEARWNAAIESFAEGAIIATEDEQVIYWNPAAQTMHGFTHFNEGIEPLEKTPITFQLWTPDGNHMLELDEWPMRRIKRGETVRNLELRIRRPDQGWEKVFSYSGVMVDTAGGERLIFLTCHDLTELRRAEEALLASEARLKRSQEVAHLGSWELDLVNNRLIWSDEVYRIFGLKAQEFGATYEAFLERVHPEDRQTVNDAYSSSIQEGRDTYEIEHRVVRKDTGEIRVVYEKCEHFRDPATGEIITSVGMVHDITERKRIELELRKSHEELEKRVQERTAELSAAVTMLEHANMELQEFTHVTSHDLQEPLRKIQTFCDLLDKRSASSLDNTGQEYLSRVLNSVRRMRQLLSDLLQLSRLAGKSEKFKAVDLGKLAHEAADLFEEELKKSAGTVKIDNLPVIDAEETQILRLFQNLIGNAVKYHDDKSLLINIFSRHDGNICEIFINDNGIGFEQEFAERIFKPFQRLHGRSQYEGTGIGLAICRKIVERHGGSIRAESEPGKGSTFIINLPVKHKRVGGTDDN